MSGPTRNYTDIERLIATRSITREISCDGKKAYRTPEYAATVARRLSKKFGERRAYFCPFCACYHLASVKEAA